MYKHIPVYVVILFLNRNADITKRHGRRIANRLSLHGLPLRVNNEAAWPPDRGGVASLLSYNQELTFFGIIIDTRNG
jgi:hypothetical protein